MEEVYKKRWEYIKSDPEGARALLLLLAAGKGTPDDFDTMIDRIIESRSNMANKPQQTILRRVMRGYGKLTIQK